MHAQDWLDGFKRRSRRAWAMVALLSTALLAACGGGTTGGVTRQDGNPSPIAGSRASQEAFSARRQRE